MLGILVITLGNGMHFPLMGQRSAALAPLIWMLRGGSFSPEETLFTSPFGLSSLKEASFENYLQAWRRARLGLEMWDYV